MHVLLGIDSAVASQLRHPLSTACSTFETWRDDDVELTAYGLGGDPNLGSPVWKRRYSDGVAVLRVEVAARGRQRNSGGMAVVLLSDGGGDQRSEADEGHHLVGYRLTDGWPSKMIALPAQLAVDSGRQNSR